MVISKCNVDRSECSDVLGDVAEVLDLGLETPVPVVLGEELVLVEETIQR